MTNRPALSQGDDGTFRRLGAGDTLDLNGAGLVDPLSPITDGGLPSSKSVRMALAGANGVAKYSPFWLKRKGNAVVRLLVDNGDPAYNQTEDIEVTTAPNGVTTVKLWLGREGAEAGQRVINGIKFRSTLPGATPCLITINRDDNFGTSVQSAGNSPPEITFQAPGTAKASDFAAALVGSMFENIITAVSGAMAGVANSGQAIGNLASVNGGAGNVSTLFSTRESIEQFVTDDPSASTVIVVPFTNGAGSDLWTDGVTVFGDCYGEYVYLGENTAAAAAGDAVTGLTLWGSPVAGQVGTIDTTDLTAVRAYADMLAGARAIGVYDGTAGTLKRGPQRCLFTTAQGAPVAGSLAYVALADDDGVGAGLGRLRATAPADPGVWQAPVGVVIDASDYGIDNSAVVDFHPVISPVQNPTP